MFSRTICPLSTWRVLQGLCWRQMCSRAPKSTSSSGWTSTCTRRSRRSHGMRRGRTLSRCISCSLTKLTLPYRLAGTALWQSGCFLTPWWACRYSIPFYWRGSGAAHLLPVNWTLLDRDSLLLIGADAKGGGEGAGRGNTATHSTPTPEPGWSLESHSSDAPHPAGRDLLPFRAEEGAVLRGTTPHVTHHR